MGSTPTTFATGYLYAGLGYTTVFDAAIPPLGARHAHEEFHDTPVIDKGFFVLVGNNHYVLDRRGRRAEQLRHFLGWLLHATKGYAIKVVNPGGVEVWKQGGNVMAASTTSCRASASPRGRSWQRLAQAADDSAAAPGARPLQPARDCRGNWATTLDTMKALEGRRAHFTHVQFHSYGGGPDDQGDVPLEGRRPRRLRERPPQPDAWTSARCCSATPRR